MRPLELILKKRDGGAFTEGEVDFLVQGFARGDIPDYQMASLLMAIVFRGMGSDETAWLTKSMIHSGKVMDLSSVKGPLVDKHSTGGVGDKVSLILAPIAAACGLRVPMMSGRGLGHTGGTLDKLESIPGYRTDLSEKRFVQALDEVGFAMIGQSDEVVPADRKMYALRDVTGTVESIPLITASIMSKKFAEGAGSLVLDVKCGSGAFMRTIEEARSLGASLVRAGAELGKRVVAVISDMDQPLGLKIGNFLEVEETIECLRGAGPPDLMGLTCRLAGWMLVLGGKCKTASEGARMARERIADGSAMRKFLANVEFQGGDPRFVERPETWPRSRFVRSMEAPRDGFVARVDARAVGVASVALGAGRSRKEDAVLPGVGITLRKTQGDRVQRGEEVALLHGDDEARITEAQSACATAIQYSSERRPASDRVLEEITKA